MCRNNRSGRQHERRGVAGSPTSACQFPAPGSHDLSAPTDTSQPGPGQNSGLEHSAHDDRVPPFFNLEGEGWTAGGVLFRKHIRRVPLLLPRREMDLVAGAPLLEPPMRSSRSMGIRRLRATSGVSRQTASPPGFATHRFVTEDGRASWIRPDGSGLLMRAADARPFLLEYDRGTLNASDYRSKLAGYRRYYAAREWQEHFPSEPVLLFVCTDERSEKRVARAASVAAVDFPLLSTTELRYLASAGVRGTLGRIWRPARGPGDLRTTWPDCD